MTTKQIVFTSECVAELLDVEYLPPEANEVTVELEYSAISSGTEKANFTGLRNGTNVSEDDAPKFPRTVGYSAAGRISAVGRAVEDLKVGEYVRVWNFLTGTYDVSPVLFIHKTERDQIVYLQFSDGTSVGVGYEHAFYSLSEKKYVAISDTNAEDFIGTTFAAMRDGQMVELTLVGVEYKTEMQTVYGVGTAMYYNHFANGLISAIPLLQPLNMFEYDGLVYDMEALARDIALYGLLPYEAVSDIVTYEQYLALNAPYLSIAIGKGITTVEELKALFIKYLPDIEIL